MRKNLKTLFIFCFVFIFFLCFPSTNLLNPTVLAQQYSGDWNMFRADPSHSGVAAGAFVTSPNLIWTFPINFVNLGFAFISSPAVVNGVVYTGSWNTYVYAINASNGNQIWNYSTGWWIQTSPAVANGMVYIANTHSGFYALNATTGEKVWSAVLTHNDNYGAYSSPTVVDGVVYIGCSSGDLFAFNAFNGNQIWDVRLDGAVESSPAVENDIVYVGSFGSLTVPFNSGRVYAVNAANGAMLWSTNFTQPISSSPTAGNGFVYVGCRDNNVYALNAYTGMQLWNYTTYGEVNSSPALLNGELYVISQDSSLYALNASSGEEIWGHDIGQSSSNPVINDGTILSASNDGRIYALNATNGNNIWTYSVNQTGLFSDVVIANGNVYFNSQNGIYAFGIKPLAIPSSTPTQTVPEFPGLVILPLILFFLLVVFVILGHRKTTKLNLGEFAHALHLASFGRVVSVPIWARLKYKP